MDPGNLTLIKTDKETIDITLLDNVKIVQLDRAMILVKELDSETIVPCDYLCEDLSIYLLQYVGNDFEMRHIFTCTEHLHDAIENKFKCLYSELLLQ